MSFLPFIFFIVSALALLITFFSINPKKTAMETVNDMGIGYNLGNSFESFNISVKKIIQMIKLHYGEMKFLQKI